MSAGAFKSQEAKRRVFESYGRLLERWPVPVEEIDVETRFGSIHVVRCGREDGPPLVLLHGGGGNAGMWFANVESLGRQFRIHALDIPGEMGKSYDQRHPFDSEALITGLAEALESLGLGAVHLVGSSLGAALSILFAGRHPERIRSLVMASPPSLEKIRGPFALRGLWTVLWPSPSRVRRFYDYITAPGGEAPPDWALDDQVTRFQAQRIDLRPIEPATPDQLAALPRRSLLLLGEQDPIYPLAEALDRISRHAPHVEIVTVPEAGHVICVEQPEVFNREVLRFVREG